jgi:hypothetical protein
VRKYRVDRILGHGAMGMVVAATHVLLDTPVALELVEDERLAVAMSEGRSPAAPRGAPRDQQRRGEALMRYRMHDMIGVASGTSAATMACPPTGTAVPEVARRRTGARPLRRAPLGAVGRQRPPRLRRSRPYGHAGGGSSAQRTAAGDGHAASSSSGTQASARVETLA